MAFTGGYSFAAALTEGMIAEVVTAGEQLFGGSGLPSSAPRLLPDRFAFPFQQTVNLTACVPTPVTNPTIGNVCFRRMAPLAANQVRLVSLPPSSAGGSVRPGVRISSISGAMYSENVSTLGCNASLAAIGGFNPASFVFDLDLEISDDQASLRDPLNGKPFHRPPSGAAYGRSDDWARRARIYGEENEERRAISGVSGDVFSTPRVRRGSDEFPLRHADERVVETVEIYSFVVLKDFFSLAAGPSRALVEVFLLLDPSDAPSVQARQSLDAAFGSGAGPAVLIPALSAVRDVAVGREAHVEHVWFQADSVNVTSYVPGFLSGAILSTPACPDFSTQAGFAGFLQSLVSGVLAAPVLPIAFSPEGLSAENPLEFGTSRVDLGIRDVSPTVRALFLGATVEDDASGNLDEIVPFPNADFTFHLSESVVNRTFKALLPVFKRGTKDENGKVDVKGFDTKKKTLKKIAIELHNGKIELKLDFRYWVVGNKNTTIQDAVDVDASNIFLKPRLYDDYLKDKELRPLDACGSLIEEVAPGAIADPGAINDPANAVCYLSFVHPPSCQNPANCYPLPAALSTAGTDCLEIGHDRDRDGLFDAVHEDIDGDGLIDGDLDDDNDGLSDEDEAEDLDRDERLGEQEPQAEDADSDGRAGERECDEDGDGRILESEPVDPELDIDGDGNFGEFEPRTKDFDGDGLFGETECFDLDGDGIRCERESQEDLDGDATYCEIEDPAIDLDGDGRAGEIEERFTDCTGPDGSDPCLSGDPDDDNDGTPDEDDIEPTIERREFPAADCFGSAYFERDGESILAQCRGGLIFTECRKVPDFQAFPQLKHIKSLINGVDAEDADISVQNGITGALVRSLDTFFLNFGLVLTGAVAGFFGKVDKRNSPSMLALLHLFSAFGVTKRNLEDPLRKDLAPRNSEDQLVGLVPLNSSTNIALFVRALEIRPEALTIAGDGVVIHNIFNPQQTHPVNCAIATAAFGSPLEPEIEWLRLFRDNWLMRSRPGRALVRVYYRHAPVAASQLRRSPFACRLVRLGLRPVIALVRLAMHKSARRPR